MLGYGFRSHLGAGLVLGGGFHTRFGGIIAHGDGPLGILHGEAALDFSLTLEWVTGLH
jgi:hypothetical protein